MVIFSISNYHMRSMVPKRESLKPLVRLNPEYLFTLQVYPSNWLLVKQTLNPEYVLHLIMTFDGFARIFLVVKCCLGIK